MSNPRIYPINPLIDEKLEQIRTLDKAIKSKQDESLRLKREWLESQGESADVLKMLSMESLDRIIAERAS